MEYITVKEAAQKWNISIRRVQYLCEHEKIPGAIRFNKMWAIPKEADRPNDKRKKAKNKHDDNIEQLLSFRTEDKDMLSKIIELFPYPIHVYSPDGTMILTNRACLELMHIPSKDKIVGKFNVLKDPVIDKWGEGVREKIALSFKGQTIKFNDLKMPINSIIERFGQDEHSLDISFLNIVCFPIFNDNNKLLYVVNVFITSKVFSGKEEIVKAKEYIESHCLEEFNLDDVANAINLSRYHFVRVFKKQTGITPYSYYLDVKINKIKDMLCDKNLTISQVFLKCGAAYNGNFARIFKERVGMTPTKYRHFITKE